MPMIKSSSQINLFTESWQEGASQQQIPMNGLIGSGGKGNPK